MDRNSQGMNIILSTTVVALRKESVDRNRGNIRGRCVCCRRSPQGERG